jgi:hypothetical protein
MRHLMFCISGYSGTGKDEVAGRIVRAHRGIQTGLADPAKRHMADVYGFTERQLFGPSAARNEGDLRYPKETFHKLGLKPSRHGTGEYGKVTEIQLMGHDGWFLELPEIQEAPLEVEKKYWTFTGRDVPEARATNRPCRLPPLSWQPLRLGGARYFVPEGDPRFWLCPREPLQDYCDLMNTLYLRTWSRKGVEIHRQLARVHQRDGGMVFFRHSYSRMMGVVENDLDDGENWQETDGTFVSCFADFRHWHEIREAHQAEGVTAVLVRVRRPSVPEPPYDHRSETEQAEIPDNMFDFVLDNDGTLEDLYAKVDGVVAETKEDRWEPTRRPPTERIA